MKSAILAVSSHEGKYLRDWLDYHYALGFSHVFLFDSCLDHETFKVCQPYAWNGALTFIPALGKPIQWEAYARGFSFTANHFDWVMVIDLDEYLVLKKHDSINELIHDIEARDLTKKIGSISFPWSCFGSSGHEKFEDVPVWKRFTHRVDYEGAHGHTRHVKSLVRPESVRFVNDPHFFHVSGDYKCVDTNFRQIHTSEFKWDNIPDNVALINHYVLKSAEEWGWKMHRGSADLHHLNPETHRTMQRFLDADKSCIKEDKSIFEFIKRLQNKGKLTSERYSIPSSY